MAIPTVTDGTVIDDSWGNDVADALNNLVVTGTYTPALNGLAQGTGGSNTANYTFIGGRDIGEKGTLSLQGKLTFGTAGQTFPNSPSFGLPSGFAIDGASYEAGRTVIGDCTLYDDSASVPYYGGVEYVTTTSVRLFNLAVNGIYPVRHTVTTTLPFTWAAADSIFWNVSITVVRV